MEGVVAVTEAADNYDNGDGFNPSTSAEGAADNSDNPCARATSGTNNTGRRPVVLHPILRAAARSPHD